MFFALAWHFTMRERDSDFTSGKDEPLYKFQISAKGWNGGAVRGAAALLLLNLPDS